MGISVAEYFASKEACPDCDSKGDQEHCVTTLLSRPDNCLIYNALVYRREGLNPADSQTMQKMRSTLPEAMVVDYYVRAEQIMKILRQEHEYDPDFWSSIYQDYVIAILTELKIGNGDGALTRMLRMLEEFEQKTLKVV